jgi:hypothetical protein
MKKKEREEVITPLVTRERTMKTIVVDESDKRAALSNKNAIDLF